MLQLDHVLARAKRKYNFYQVERYLRNRKVYHYAPYPLEIYEQSLKNLKFSPNHQLVPFLNDEEINRGRDWIFVRHDIDTQQCMKNLSEIINIDGRLMVKSGIYLRIDDEEYSVRDHRDMLLQYRERGFEIGLHSLCYLKENYSKEFQRETEKFKYDMGFQPRSFSVHGVGSFRLETRMKFYEEVVHWLHPMGYETGDIPTLRSYVHVIHDSHLDAENRRFLYDDFFHLPDLSFRGNCYLIMTHPCYWKV